MNARARHVLAFLVPILVSLPTMSTADKLDRSKRPPVGPAPALVAPPVIKRQLPNGLVVWIVRRPSLPLASFVLQIRGGSSLDAKAGIASMTAALLDDGTRRLSAREFVNAVEALGATLGASASEEQTVVSLNALTRHLDDALVLMGEMVTTPAFREEEIERERAARLQALKQQKDQPVIVATNVFQRVVYGMEHPYGRPVSGTIASVQSVTHDDLVHFYDQVYRPNNAVLIAVGDVSEQDLMPRLERVFGGWKTQPVPAAASAAPPRPAPRPLGVYLVDKPGAAQSEIRVGHAGAARSTTPDYDALQVLNLLLGGQFTSRVNLNLRERHGFTYGARTAWAFRRGDGPFYASAGVFTAKTDSSVAEFLRELKDVRGSRPATAEETARAKNALIRSYPRRLETNDGVASVLADLAFYGLDESEITEYNRRIAQVTPEEVTRIASKYIDPSSLAIVVVGDVAKIRGGIEALALGPVKVLDADANEVKTP
ncbi:MAG: insulinase family protein [Candidatus Eisenbacteria bacterium]|uniref:Insulinase family protein n=1 Tax=Eiseniibacteriota bacterium TaxID=2212470 RepID=A0A538TZZ6_UNCEI|nr:MAG: insulinase family protein [Candidatus Eisenbacteria bacterium]